MIASALVIAIALLAPQDPARLRVGEPTPAVVRLGESSAIELSTPDSRARIVPRVPNVDGLRFAESGISRESFQSIVNGRIETRSSASMKVIVTPLRAGRFEIPPFVVEVDGTQVQTRPLVLEAVADLRGSKHAYISVEPSSRRLYVHEPLRLAVEIGLDQALQVVEGRTPDGRPGFKAEIQAPWLDELPGAVRIAADPGTPERVMFVNSAAQEADYVSGHERDGRRFHRLSFVRAFLPTQSGRLELPQPTLRYVIASGPERRGMFGERMPAEEQNLFAYGEPAVVEVLPIPAEGRPADYSGAVGRFELHAAADRREVRVGNSVKLTVAIKGLGNTEFLRVPDLERLQGFHLRGKTEHRSAEEVVAIYDLTPLSTDVREIPAIRWSYFDTRPGVEQYRTLATEPIPLDVQPLPEGGGLAALPGNEAAPVVPGVDDIHDIVPLDGGEAWQVRPVPAAWISGLLLLAPWVLVGLAIWWLPRAAARRADVHGRRARGAARAFERALGRGVDPGEALVEYLAARLGVPPAAVIEPELARRLQQAGFDAALARRLQQAVEAGVAARYGGVAALGVGDARALVAAAESHSTAPAAIGLGLLLVLAGGGGVAQEDRAAAQEREVASQDERGGAPHRVAVAPEHGGASQDPRRGAQHPDAAPQTAGIAAYRRGDYATAGAEFARAAAASEDRRLDYNLGNSAYRQGQLARALLHYERARLAAPRDPELLANIALVRRKLGLGAAEQESFLGAVAALRDRFTGPELLAFAIAAHTLVALLLWSGRRRPLLRALALLCFVPAVLLALELLWWRPARPPHGIVLGATSVRAEPRDDLPAVLELKPGVTVAVLAAGDRFTKIRAAGRSGWIHTDSVGTVE